MNEVEIIERLTPIARRIFKDETLLIDVNLDFTKVPNWSSLTFTSLLASVEADFGFRFNMMEILQIHNIGDIVKMINNHLSHV